MSNEFLAGAASWFGMDPDRLADATMSTNAQGLTLVFKIKLDADDYLGIADRMRAMREPIDDPEDEEQEDPPRFAIMPTLNQVLNDPATYMDRPECADLLAKAAKLSKRVARVLGLEPDPYAPTEGVNGRTVVHVDVPAEADSGLPDAVWVCGHELDDMQKQLSSDRDVQTGAYLIQVAMLTPEQVAKRVKP